VSVIGEVSAIREVTAIGEVSAIFPVSAIFLVSAERSNNFYLSASNNSIGTNKGEKITY